MGYLRLVSADGHQFFLDRRIAYECDTFRKMVEQEGFKEGQLNTINLPTIPGKLLEKVIEYLYYKYKYTDAKTTIPDPPSSPDMYSACACALHAGRSRSKLAEASALE